MEARLLCVKDKKCFVLNLDSSEVRLKVRWVPLHVPDDAPRSAFEQYGKVQEIARHSPQPEAVRRHSSRRRLSTALLWLVSASSAAYWMDIWEVLTFVQRSGLVCELNSLSRYTQKLSAISILWHQLLLVVFSQSHLRFQSLSLKSVQSHDFSVAKYQRTWNKLCRHLLNRMGL